jgi:hypothetical protein
MAYFFLKNKAKDLPFSFNKEKSLEVSYIHAIATFVGERKRIY